jgi:hypothetical protein
MGIAIGAGKLILSVAIAIGLVGKFKPTLFLKLPMGFIPWAMTGNIMPPCVFHIHMSQVFWGLSLSL